MLGDLYHALIQTPHNDLVKRFDAMTEATLASLTEDMGNRLKHLGISNVPDPRAPDTFDRALGLLRYVDAAIYDAWETMNNRIFPV